MAMKFLTAGFSEKQTFIGMVIENENELIHLGELEQLIFGQKTFPTKMIELIEKEDEWLPKIKEAWKIAKEKGVLQKVTYRMADVKFYPPLTNFKKNIFCIGKNYREHALEMGGEESVPSNLIVFTKAPTTVIGHQDNIPSHKEITNALDYEGELAVIIGKKGKNITKESAMEHIFGYTILNDVTARDLQAKHQQFFLGKSLDGTCPLGPWIVHRSQISDPRLLIIETRVNGELRQKAFIGDMLFSIEEIIETISRGMTLEPGDIIATGTSSGVGKGFQPPKYLKPGDCIEISIEGIGVLRNSVGN